MEITEKINTIYLGGGTPSQLTAQQINKLITEIYSCFEVDQQAEITIEANPDDISEEWLDGIANSGVNRISLGIQTFNEKELTFLKRRHTGKQAINAVKTCQKHGFKNMSIDLIYGLPHQDLQDWQNNIDIALDLNIQHLSAYALIYEENTLLWRMKQKREVSEANDEYSLEMFETLIKKLTASGFEHYEISNFSQPGFNSKHNLNYWNNNTYYGFGAAAHGYVDGIRYFNKETLEDYIENPLCREGEHNVTEKEQLEEEIFLGFRRGAGIDVEKLNKKYSIDFEKKYKNILEKYLTTGHLLKTNNGYKFSDEGFMVSNVILSEFL